MRINTPRGLAVAAALITPLSGFAEHKDDVGKLRESKPARLSTITVEGRYERQGTTEVQPGTGGTLDTSELLQRVPGANVNRNGPLTNLPQYRGSYGNQVNVMVDGVNLKEVGPNAMDTSLSNIPQAVAKTVKVYRGIAPVSSGMETIGGTIVTESLKGDFAAEGEIETHGRASTGYSWVNSGRYAGINASIANENHRAYFNGTYEKGVDYTFTDQKAVRPSGYERSTWGVGYGFQMDAHEAGIGYDHKSTINTGTPSLPMDINYIRGDVINLNYSGEFADRYQVEAGGFFQSSTHQMDNFTLRPVAMVPMNPMMPVGPGNPLVPRFRAQDTLVTAGGYRAAVTIPELLNGDLKIGVDGDLAEHRATVLDPTNANFFITNFNNATQDRYGVFTEWNGQFLDDWSLELGLRYNRIEMNAGEVGSSLMLPPPQMLAARFNAADRNKVNNNIDGVAVLRYAAHKNLDLELGFGSKQRAPSYQQRYLWLPLEATGGLADGRIYVGDVALKSERSYEVELAVDFHTDDYYLTPAFFYRYVDNYIQGTPVTDPATLMVANVIQPGACTMRGNCPLQFSNINAQFIGTDLEAGFAVTDYLRFDGILSYVRGTRVGSISDNLYRIAPLNGRLKMTFEYDDWMAYTEFVGAAKQVSTSAFNGEIPTGGYGLFNLRIQYQPKYNYVDGLTVAFGVDNMLDKNYAPHLNGLNRARNPEVAVGQRVPNPGRNIYLSANFDW